VHCALLDAAKTTLVWSARPDDAPSRRHSPTLTARSLQRRAAPRRAAPAPRAPQARGGRA